MYIVYTIDFPFYYSKLFKQIIKFLNSVTLCSILERSAENFYATISTQISIGSSNSMKFLYHIKQKAKQNTDQSYSLCVRRVSFHNTIIENQTRWQSYIKKEQKHYEILIYCMKKRNICLHVTIHFEVEKINALLKVFALLTTVLCSDEHILNALGQFFVWYANLIEIE